MTKPPKRALARTTPQGPKFLASIEHVAGQFTASYQVHRLARTDAEHFGPCSTFGAARLWLESEARKLGLPVIWQKQSYDPDKGGLG